MSDLKDLIDRIHYSDKYNDDLFEYRHVILPKQMLKHIPNNYFTEPNGTLRLLAEREWREIGIMQSVGWEHYETHAPERHILLFRREKDYLEKYGAHGRGAPQRNAPVHPNLDKDVSESDEE